jgi:hypothetical protein
MRKWKGLSTYQLPALTKIIVTRWSSNPTILGSYRYLKALLKVFMFVFESIVPYFSKHFTVGIVSFCIFYWFLKIGEQYVHGVGEPLWLIGKVMEWENKQNQKIPGSLPSLGNL